MFVVPTTKETGVESGKFLVWKDHTVLLQFRTWCPQPPTTRKRIRYPAKKAVNDVLLAIFTHFHFRFRRRFYCFDCCCRRACRRRRRCMLLSLRRPTVPTRRCSHCCLLGCCCCCCCCPERVFMCVCVQCTQRNVQDVLYDCTARCLIHTHHKRQEFPSWYSSDFAEHVHSIYCILTLRTEYRRSIAPNFVQQHLISPPCFY